MNDYYRVFSVRHAVLPVIHVVSRRQALENCHLACSAGADGVFLINHDIGPLKLLEIHAEVVREFSDWWVGVNCLGMEPDEVFETVSEQVAGVWADNARIEENHHEQFAAEAIQVARQRSGWKGLYFGGVAFKYQRPVEDVARAAQVASRYMDVVTTSGPGTGRAASLEKIRAMKHRLGQFPLAIASGITPDNIDDYLPIADCFLVATGISGSFDELDPELTVELASKVRSYDEDQQHDPKTFPMTKDETP